MMSLSPQSGAHGRSAALYTTLLFSLCSSDRMTSLWPPSAADSESKLDKMSWVMTLSNSVTSVFSFCAALHAGLFYLVDNLKKRFSLTSYYANTSWNILRFFTSIKTILFRWKLWYFSYFCSKNRPWVHVRTASMRWFKRVPTIYVLQQK